MISEFLASNDSELADEDGEFSDWIEIHNPDAVAVNMSGWHLTDNAGNLDKWTFPNVTIPAGGYLVVFASDKDRTVPGNELHTNFKLSAEGEYLALVMPNGSTKTTEFNPFPAQYTDVSYGTNGTTVLVAENAALKYVLNTPSNDGTGKNWTEHDFNDNTWNGGSAGIGYDNGSDYDSVIQTQVPSGTTETWIRFSFQVTDPTELSGLLLSLRYDDGFQAYINGTSVASANISGGTSPSESNDFVDFDLSSYQSALRTGENVLAIRLVNSSSSSSDLLLIPRLMATVVSSSESFTFLTDPTPGFSNQSGVLNPGPIVSDVQHTPDLPQDNESLLITALVQPRGAAVASVSLKYRVNYAGEITMAMNDNGTGGDVSAGDGIFSAVIPASVAGPGQMVRWKILATDSDSLESTLPLITDTTGNSQSPQYYGTMIAQPSVEQGIPVMHWFTQDASNARNRTGSRASVFYLGKFYDNIYVRQRGGYTNTNSQKFDFNKGHPFYANDQMPAVGEVNMNSNGADSSYVRQPMGFNFHQAAGNPGSIAYPVQMRLNGSQDRVGILIEQVDEDYLIRNGHDNTPGDLYKLVQRSNLNPVFDDTSTGVEKKTGDLNDFSSLQDLVDDLKLGSSTVRVNRFYDNMDVQEFTNYMAIRALQQQADDVRKNFYVYQDTHGDERWRIFPWDLDYTWDIAGGHGEERADHPFFGIEAFPSDDGNHQWNRLYDVAFEDVTMQRLMLRRLRTLMDDYLKPTPSGGWFEAKVDEVFDSMAGLPGPNSGNRNSLRNTEIPERRNELYNIYTTSIPGMATVIPAAQPSNPVILIDQVDFNPASGDQDEEYIRISNSENTEIDISGWSLSSAVTFTFPAGTVIPRNGEIFVSPDLKKFASRSTSPKALERRLVSGPYQGHLSSLGETIVLTDASANVVQSYSYEGDPSPAQEFLVISQMNYAPQMNPDAEYIEIMNISFTETVSLAGVKFVNGVDFDFTSSSVTSLAPGEVVLVVKNQSAFTSVFGNSVTARIAGEFSGGTSLNNAGETIKLDDAAGATIHDFTYDDVAPWPVASGRALVLINPTIRPDHDEPSNWMLSSDEEGSPAGAVSGFTGWLADRGETDPLSDNDHDGWSELLTYALGRDLAGEDFVHHGSVQTLNVNGIDGDYLTLTSTIRDTNSAEVIPQVSDSLSNWTDATEGMDVIRVSDVANGDGTRTVTYRSIAPIVPGNQQFMRLKVSQ
ncbi:lamin tail domain-containing protein [Oceaniferula spumae]|uniref:lamin tail domain-containing protein n=1 Tax=Oceaniferula spumae TaxID=2979115 RepID=UPI003F4EF906